MYLLEFRSLLTGRQTLTCLRVNNAHGDTGMNDLQVSNEYDDKQVELEVSQGAFKGITEELKKVAKKYSDSESRLIIIFDQDGVSCERQWL